MAGYQNHGFREYTPGGFSSLATLTPKIRSNKIKKSLLAALVLSLSACREVILHDLGENEVNKLITRLHDVQIDATKERQPDGRFGIGVAGEDYQKAISFLNGARLLPTSSQTPKEKSGLVSSREEQLLRYEQARGDEIAGSLASLDGVLEARVHLNLPPTDPIFGRALDSQQKGSASVLLIVERDLNTPREEVAALVAGAAGLDPKNISVLVSPGRLPERPVTLGPGAPSTKLPAFFSQTEIIGAGILFIVGLGLLFGPRLFSKRIVPLLAKG